MTYHLLCVSIKAISYLPFCILYILSDVSGFVLYHLIRYRRTIVRRNLSESFPEKSLDEIKSIERGFYRFFADNIFETCKMATISPEEMSRRMRFTNMDEISERLSDGRSIALYLGHYANWEWVSSIPVHLEKRFAAAQIYHKLRNANFDRLMIGIRSRMGSKCVEMRQTARYITNMVTDGKVSITGFIADQSPKRKDIRHYIEFLHHRTPVVTGTEKIAKHYGFDAWFLRTTRVKRGYYEAEFIRMHDDPKSLPDFELTDIYFRLLEQDIRRRPELYLWSHNRFKYAERSNSEQNPDINRHGN